MGSTVDKIANIISEYSNANTSQVFGQNLFKPSYISGLGKKMVKEDLMLYQITMVKAIILILKKKYSQHTLVLT